MQKLSLLILSFLFYIANKAAHTYEYFPDMIAHINNRIYLVSLNIVVIFALLFTMKFLETKKYSKLTNTLFTSVYWLAVIMLPLSVSKYIK